VRKGGTFIGARHIDLPVDFALRFEEPVADAWAITLLKEIRSTTKEFTDDCISLVDEVVGWAKAQGTRVSADLIEAQREAIKADSKKLTAVGKEMIQELRESVKTSLIKCIEPPIRRKCAAFVKKGDDVGTGVKSRILDLFSELAEDVIAAASEPAIELLGTTFRDVEAEIRAVLKQYDDPLLTSADAIVSSQENRIRRSDAQKRKTVLSEIRAILESIPDSYRSIHSVDQ
jgi:vacuolar-type H+-ATPase subunit H